MFDGVLPREEPEPEDTIAAMAEWSWPLTLLVAGVTVLAIFAAVQFPDVVGAASEHF
jgi:hypothetical protein